MNQLHHGGLMRCCVQDFVQRFLRGVGYVGVSIFQTACCNQYIERRPDGDWQWVGVDRQREMEEQE